MLKNPLNCSDIGYDVDVEDFPTDDEVWDEIPIEELEEHREQWDIPILKENNIEAFNDISLGNYRYAWLKRYQFFKLLIFFSHTTSYL